MKDIKPNHTQIPNYYLDDLMPVLSGAEWKVLCYIARRTFGFHKSSDSISLTQMEGGITKADGTVLDRGTGLSRPGVVKCIKSLVSYGILNVSKKRGTNVYSLVKSVNHKQVVNSVNQVVNSVNQASKLSLPVLVNSVNTQKKGKESIQNKGEQKKVANLPKGEIYTPTPKELNASFFEKGNMYTELGKYFVGNGMDREAVKREFDKFVFYWTEPNPSGKKQKWQLQKTFDVKRRIVTWLENSGKWKKKKERSTKSINLNEM